MTATSTTTKDGPATTTMMVMPMTVTATTVTATGGGGVRIVVVAILPSYLLFGWAFGTNPPVGIGPWQMPPSRVCGLFRLRGPQPHIPPTPPVRVGGGGLMKGTPRNIFFVTGIGDMTR